MIFEVITYELKPATMAEVEKQYGETYEYRKKYSVLAASWHTEIGPLNQLITVWPYKDLAERERICAAAQSDPNCTPKIRDSVLGVRSEIVIPAPFAPELKPANMGPFFEMRTYNLPLGEVPLVLENWGRAMPKRLEISPVCALWYSEIGGLNRWTHIWAYKSLNDRMDLRAKARAVWPPAAMARKEGRPAEVFLVQENKIVMPSAFSPIQ